MVEKQNDAAYLGQFGLQQAGYSYFADKSLKRSKGHTHISAYELTY